jgi:hypothetical protein
MLAGIFLVLTGLVSLVVSLGQQPAAQFFQVTSYHDNLCANSMLIQITQLNYCGPSAAHKAEFVKVTVEPEAATYQLTDTYFTDSICTQLSQLFPQRLRPFLLFLVNSLLPLKSFLPFLCLRRQNSTSP